jgi:hypothetical protein
MHVGMISAPSATPRTSSLRFVRRTFTRIASRVSATVAEFRAPTPAPAPVVVEPMADESVFFTEADMPPAEDIAEAARLYWRAADEARAAERAKRRARKILDKLRSGTYSGWQVERVESSRSTVDLDAVRKIFREHGLGPVPMKASAPSLRISRVESEALATTATDAEFAALAAAMTR